MRLIYVVASLTASFVAACLFPSVDGLGGDGGVDAVAPTPEAGEAGEAGEDSDAGSLTYQQMVQSDFPAMYLRLDESAGPEAHDVTGDGYNGTYADAGIIYGVPGAIANDPDTAVTFDGLHSISTGPSFPFTGTAPFTIEFWANQTAYAGYGFTVDHDDWNADGGRTGWDVLLAQNDVSGERFSLGTTSGSNVHTNVALTLAQWHHVVTTFDGATLCIYVDSVASCNPGAGSFMAAANIVWTIGAPHTGAANGLKGSMDEFALYTHALTGDRVAAHYHQGIGH